MMYDAAAILEGFTGLIGWRNHVLPETPELSAAIQEARSGLYFNDQHPLLTYPNLNALCPDFALVHYAEWHHTTNYVVGDRVKRQSDIYEAIAPSLNQQPPNATYWKKILLFSDWLTEKTNAGVLRAIEDWIAAKFEQRTARSLIHSAKMFSGADARMTEDMNYLGWAGIEMMTVRSDNVILRIDQVALTLSEAQSVTVYLFASNQAGAIESKELAYTDAGSEQWFTLDWVVPAGPTYHIAYDQAQISGASLNTTSATWPAFRAFSDACEDCASYVFPSVFTAKKLDGGGFTGLKNAYTTATNYGMNLRLSARCDYTRFILTQGDVLKGIIAKQVAMSLLREMAYNPQSRVNRNESNISMREILYEIDGDSQGRFPGGLRAQYEKELKAARFDMENIDRICLPCRKSGVKYRGV